jgi:hypothetical protein
MREDYRLFSCARCHRLVAICSVCDRGQWYCGKSCSQQARRERARAASQRYQATRKGRRNHAARQARHRQKRRAASRSTQQVTHRGTPPQPAEVTLRATIAESPATTRCTQTAAGRQAGDGGVRCDFCGALCQPFARREPLRCRRRRRAIDPRRSRAGSVSPTGGRPAREIERRPP